MILQKEISTRVATMVILIALLFSVVGVQVAYARTNNNDTVVSLSQQQDNVAVKMILPAMTVATSTVLVDVSNTTNFKHVGSVLEVSKISFAFSSETAATTTLKIGLIASTSASGALADVYWFDEVSFVTASSSLANYRQEKVLDYGVSAIKLGVSGGLPTGFLSNDKATSFSGFATTTKVSSPIGLTSAGSGSLPGVGDLVMSVYSMQGVATTSVTVIYRAK